MNRALNRYMFKRMYVTYTLIALNVVIWVISVIINKNSDPGFYDITSTDFGLIPALVGDGEFYRIITSMFLHSGIKHLVMNMLALYGIGRILEPIAGHTKMLIIYLVSGICGGILVCRIAEPLSVTVGASGAIFGIAAACVVALFMAGDTMMLRNVIIFVALNLVNTFTEPNISIGGHVGGMVGGLIIGLLLLRRRRRF